ncbi:DUF4421 domain-containing protein [Chitinophagaceae bacterium LB-8]|uniref:DUF4421 domain-containing protein n=1 Tax=Paraflavisolibacter caeni TaxID=2982496 RepID=A0A9X3BIE9_9BACT|nr:DUF4421 family protein [Paraflavisolibacter caeni]MCU7549953.1 DUF4421 domain-containing protein [Paraflavisolibacter caeni]
MQSLLCQQNKDSTLHSHKNTKDSIYMIRLDTLLHLQSWISANQMKYTLVYNEDFKLVLAPNETNNLSFGFSYRYLDLGLSFSPQFLNADQDNDQKGASEQFSFRTGFGIHRFYLNFDLSSVKGFYLKNSVDFSRGSLPDSPYLVYPDLTIKNFSTMVRYNANQKFSTAALAGGTQVQRRSAYTILPSLQFATFNFHDDSKNTGVQNESTYSTDLNVLLPVAGTLVISPKFSASLVVGPSFGVDFFKSVSIDDSNKVVLSKGTKFTTGYSLQTSISYHSKRFFAGFESRNRSYGHKIEDISRLIKQYSYFQVFIGWRLTAPRFAKRSLDWVNKISPINFD